MRSLAGVLFAWLGAAMLASGAVTVTLRQATVIQELDATGQTCGVILGNAGDTFTLDHQEGPNVVLKNAAGELFRMPIAATDFIPHAAKPADAPPSSSTGAVTPASPSPALIETATSPLAPSASATGTSARSDEIKKLNDALGQPLVTDADFWQEDVGKIAERLGWPEESRTSTEASFRRYALNKQISFCGAHANSLALYGKMGKPTYLSIIFANAGDFLESMSTLPRQDSSNSSRDVDDLLEEAVKKDASTVSAALTPLLGNAAISLFGNSSSNRDEVHRWDWHDMSFLLNSHQGRYTSLKIIPSSVADHFGTVEVTDREQMKDILGKRVVKRDNGDVLVTDLPMVDQGPKGYCVPATWERYLRYMDVPADLYVLAIMGNSGLGGGTTIGGMRAGVSDYVSAYHRRIEDDEAPLDVSHVKRYIDQGLPLMWTCWIAKDVEIQSSKNTLARKAATDLSAYRKDLAAQDKALGSDFQAMDPGRDNGHMRLVIGYNEATDEIAISDSWGAAAAERWLYVPTANRISQGDLTYLSW